MKKILFTLLICLFMIPGVNADTAITFEEFTQEECSTTTLNYSDFIHPEHYTKGTLYYDNGLFYNSSGLFYKRYILLNSNTQYYIVAINFCKFNLLFFDTKFNYISSLELSTTNAGTPGMQTFTPPSTSNGYVYMFYSVSKSANYYFFDEEPPKDDWYSKPLEATECPIVEPEEPETPPIVPDEPVIADTTLDNFYSIYISKLQYLFQYAFENKFILGFIGIVLLFIVLEIILNLFRKRGHY